MPTFTRKLTYPEQLALSPADESAYWDWLFGVNEPVCRRRERDQRRERRPNADWDQQRAILDDEHYEVTPRQFGSGV